MPYLKLEQYNHHHRKPHELAPFQRWPTTHRCWWRCLCWSATVGPLVLLPLCHLWIGPGQVLAGIFRFMANDYWHAILGQFGRFSPFLADFPPIFQAPRSPTGKWWSARIVFIVRCTGAKWWRWRKGPRGPRGSRTSGRRTAQGTPNSGGNAARRSSTPTGARRGKDGNIRHFGHNFDFWPWTWTKSGWLRITLHPISFFWLQSNWIWHPKTQVQFGNFALGNF